MDFTRIDLESTVPPQYLCCEKCIKAYVNDTIVQRLRCPTCGALLFVGNSQEGIEHYMKLLEENRK